MADQRIQLIEQMAKDLDTIQDNLKKVQELLVQSLAGEDWDRITAIGIEGKLLDVCRTDIDTVKSYIQQIEEKKNDES